MSEGLTDCLDDMVEWLTACQFDYKIMVEWLSGCLDYNYYG